MHSVELFCQRPLGASYVICGEWHYKACLGKAADLQKAIELIVERLRIAEQCCGEPIVGKVMPNGDAMELAGSEGRPRNNFAQKNGPTTLPEYCS
ncbi:hypothetical protein CI15_09980 [Paraburkholderia monticola]|uniref:Uncharacterized protein n=1 Tax=Paraburkholderia monticola TaxID=1399968 RepID=A0A149PWC2_9BURK|nr:hypothetical protein [Paraburkholderia monticola]KXU89343.1 hypothetical protein CI15_09980 [Paraburkholderia monticola]